MTVPITADLAGYMAYWDRVIIRVCAFEAVLVVAHGVYLYVLKRWL